MRWLILALALGTTFATLWRGIWLFISSIGETARTASSSSFWWAIALCVGSLFGFIGGVLAFNNKMVSLLFLISATVITFFGDNTEYRILASSFAALSFLTLIYLIMHQRSKMGRLQYDFDGRFNEEYDDDDVEDDEDDNEQEEASIPIKCKMPKRRPYSMPESSDSLIIKHPQRQRENKVCLSCGINIPISYKFCPSCGAELHIPPTNNMDEILEGMAEESIEAEDETFKIHGVVPEVNNKRFKLRYNATDDDERKEDDIRISENSINENIGEVEVVPVVRKIVQEDEDTEEVKDSDDVPFKPLSVQTKKGRKLDIDSSYQSFGRYTQSRKRRKVSIFQRTLLVLLIFGIFLSVGWLFYEGIKKGPTPPIVAEEPRISPEMTEVISDFPEILSEDIPLEIVAPTLSAATLPYMEAAAAKQVIIIGSGVNLREDHSTTSRRIASIQANATHDLLEQWKADDVSSLPAGDRTLNGPWYRIQAGGNTGWIYGQYAMPLDGRPASLPAGYTDALLNSFGSNREEIEAKLGAARQQNRGNTLEYTNLRIVLNQNKVQSIQITGRGHSLLNNLAVGMTFDEMSKIIGAPNRFRDGALLYLETANRGIVIRRENDGRIRSINVGGI